MGGAIREWTQDGNPQWNRGKGILANIIIFICGNLAGAYHKHLMELALKQTYQDTCNCIKSPIKLEFEKRQQERLLLSLLPAHIARVMKAEIIQRLQGPKFGQVENTNNFHNLYVQRHTNVSQSMRVEHKLKPEYPL
ncbi:Adenylate cyclase type 2 [Anabarilius grahami]|uniref:Adenylate cyclase type 2 n=1 Tax=Anabarilius grahami TaxID=495550 RepID=A0A3N0Y8H5_ANAGA|nr:Adenylate cyclase type 2 [Anabarilius grahami]